MPRTLTTTDLDATLSQMVGIVEFLSIAWPWGTDYLTSGDRAYTWGGHTYTPNGRWGPLSNIVESADGVPHTAQMRISGVDPTTVQNAISQNICFIGITYTIGFIDSSNNLLDSPTLSWPLFLGDANIMLGPNSGEILVTVESLLADMQNRMSGQLATMADQELRFAGDTLFFNISSIPTTIVYWGQIPAWANQLAGGVGTPSLGPRTILHQQ
ncbi:MAG: hypothetical protein KGL39_40885 [Patescibacteria group bacterium]|nr:hypothetical protein [Patescibacteria group bacterium]